MMTITISPSTSNKPQIVGLSPEIDVLLCCARIHTAPSTAERIRSLIQQNFNWDYLIALAKFHKVVPLLYQNLNCLCPELVPEKTLKQLKTIVHANTYRNLFLTQKLLFILKLFEENGIPVIAFKGLTLAISAYQDISFRQISDLDFLLPKESIKPAQEILIAEGYQLKNNYEFEFHLASMDGQVHIDLHQNIAPKFYALPFNFNQLWSRIKPITLGGTTVPNLQPEDILLLLSIVWFRDCVHSNSHFSLHLLSDVDALLSNHTALNWPWILNQARSTGCDRILKLMLLSTQELLETDLPQIVLDTLQSNPLPSSLNQSVKIRLFENPNHPHLLSENSGFWESIWIYDHRFYLQCRERFRDRILYCLNWLQMCIHAVFTPNEGDFDWVVLPKFLSFLYYPLHLIRLFIKYSSKNLNLILKLVRHQNI
jgi:Uncharacterised nucleotidyltransferase